MTRKEAESKLLSLGWFETDKFLNAIEALGLIKFDPEEDEIPICNVLGIWVYHAAGLIRDLDKNGYKIVKK